ITSRIGVTGQVRSTGIKESAFTTLTQGLRYVAGNPSLRGQVIVQIIPALLVYPYVQFLAFFAAHLHGGPQTYGLLASGAGYGGVVALFILTTLGEVKHKGRVMFAAVIGYPVSVALFALSPIVPLAMLFLMINGFCNQIYTAMQNTMFLLGAREDMRGRVMGIYSMIQGFGPIGQLGMGFAIATWGPDHAVLWFEIVAIILLSITCLLSKTVREA
ncbi:MAG: MFS transporter, partial [Chloroflexota bacterium]